MKRAKILALSILALFIISLFLSAVYAANNTIDNPWINKITKSSLFTSWQEGKLDMDVSKILFFILIGIVILAIASQVPIFQDNNGEAKWYIWPVSIIGSYLGTAYLAPEEIFIMLSSWSALGVTLGIALPFVLLAYFTFSLASDTEKSAARMTRDELLSYVIWILFGFILLYRLITVVSSPNPDVKENLSSWSLWLAWILMILTALVIGFIPKIFNAIRRKATNAELDAATTTAVKSATQERLDAERLSAAAGNKAPSRILGPNGKPWNS